MTFSKTIKNICVYLPFFNQLWLIEPSAFFCVRLCRCAGTNGLVVNLSSVWMCRWRYLIYLFLISSSSNICTANSCKLSENRNLIQCISLDLCTTDTRSMAINHKRKQNTRTHRTREEKKRFIKRFSVHELYYDFFFQQWTSVCPMRVVSIDSLKIQLQ